MIIETGRFGKLSIGSEEEIHMPLGILGFPELTKYCLVDPGDETLILWLQAVDRPEIAFPVLEPKIFKPDYSVSIAGSDLRELKLESLKRAAVFSILTIPDDVNRMTANLKAPVVINLKEQLAKQVVLQENDYKIKYEIFKQLRTHIMTIQSQKNLVEARQMNKPRETSTTVLSVPEIPTSVSVKLA